MDLHPSRPRRSRASYGEKRGVRGRSNGIDAKKFHRRNGTQSHEESSQTTLATKRRSPRFRPEKKKEVIQIEDSSSDESEDDFLLDENQVRSPLPCITCFGRFHFALFDAKLLNKFSPNYLGPGNCTRETTILGGPCGGKKG